MTSLLHFIAERFAALVQLEVFGEVFVLGIEFQRLGRPFDSGFEITRLSVSGGQSIEELFVLVASLFASQCRQRDGLFAVAVFGVWAGRSEPGQIVGGQCLLGGQLRRGGEVGEGLVKIALLDVQPASMGEGHRKLRVQFDRGIQVGERLVHRFVLIEQSRS